MSTLNELLSAAMEHHRSGWLPAAEQLYRRVLEIDPAHADALHLLGLIGNQTGRYEVAVELICRAIEQSPNSAECHYNLGGAYFNLGRVSEAANCYRRMIEIQPDCALAHNNLGTSLKELGRFEEAIECYRRSVALDPQLALAQTNLGNVLRDADQFEEAAACCRRAVQLAPNFAEAHRNLGNVLHDMHALDEAVACYRRSLALNPELANAHHNLGCVLQEQGELAEATACFRQAVTLQRNDRESHKKLGQTLQQQGLLDEAIVSYCDALTLNSQDAQTLNNLGVALAARRRLDMAQSCYLQSLSLNPDQALTLNNLGNIFRDQGKLKEAVVAYRKAIEIDHGIGEIHINLCMSLLRLGKFDEAMECCQRAITINPTCPDTHNNMGVMLMSAGFLDKAIDSFRTSLSLKPDYVMARSNLLFTLQYHPEATLASLAEEHAAFDRIHTAGLRPARESTVSVRRDRTGLRIGFVSADLGRHPVGYFLIRVLENLKSVDAQKFIYSDRVVKDDFTRRFQATANAWHDTIPLTDEQLAAQIRSDEIDILFDLSGHTAHNRMLVFARKPAPVQISWIGYEGTTGLSAMDCLMADRHMIPQANEIYYREQVLRMPDGWLCFEPPEDAPPVAPLPALTNGYMTFGSFNNVTKLNERVLDVWSEILRRTPESRLFMKARGLGEQKVNQRFADAFSSRGVDPQRIQMQAPSKHAGYLASYQQIDILLDPFPFSGGTTTCDALWMGVPVITCPGETFASRHSLSHLSNVGLTETIAGNLDEYVELAVELARQPQQLAQLREGLRDRMAASPLCDGPRFANNFMNLLEHVWRRTPNDDSPAPNMVSLQNRLTSRHDKVRAC